jgi:hypothetical protein
MGSVQGLAVVHFAREPGRFGWKPSTINLPTINRSMARHLNS